MFFINLEMPLSGEDRAGGVKPSQAGVQQILSSVAVSNPDIDGADTGYFGKSEARGLDILGAVLMGLAKYHGFLSYAR